MPPAKPAKKHKQEQLAEEVKQIRKSNKENLVCADCPNRAPSYVCINFSTFVCTDCSGVHRKFGHRVKSLAVATFTEEEVEKLRQGGNEVANAHYLARYKKGVDTFVLPREGERDRIEQYLTYKYVQKKWHKESLKPKEKKVKKAGSNKKENEESEPETDEVAPAKSVSSQQSSVTRKASLKQPNEDLLSFDVNASQTTNSTAASTATKPKEEESWFDDNTGKGKEGTTNWDPWSQEETTKDSGNVSATKKDEWDDDLWGTNNNTSSNTQNVATNVTAKRNSQKLTSLYQNTNAMSSGFGPMPVNNGYPMNTVGGVMPMWAVPGTINNGIPNTVTPVQPSQSNSFLGVLSQVNQQKQEELERKKLEEDEEKRRKEQALQPSKTVPTQVVKENDPFASLMGSVDLNLRENSSTRDNSTKSNNTGYNVKPTPSVGVTYQNTSQSFPPNYSIPYVGVNGNSMMPPPSPATLFMAAPMQNTGIYQMPVPQYTTTTSPNVNMYGQFAPNTISVQPQTNLWNNSNFGTVGGTNADTDNPFR